MILISVLLPVYNAESTVAETIDSILCQTFSDFEFIIINDASTDHTEEIILSYKDPRIKYYKNSKNQGIVYTLNRGIDLANGKYIARMDADDIALPSRFGTQVNVMERDSSIVVCGTGIETFGNVKKSNRIFFPEQSDELRDLLVRSSCFAHPTVFIRRKVLADHNLYYKSEYRHAEDYKLWIDLSAHGNFYNIHEILLRYRMSDTQITTYHKQEVDNIAKKCRREYIAKCFEDKKLNDTISDYIISIQTIKMAHRYRSIRLLEVLYMSLSHYRLYDFFYFVFSLDFLKFSFRVQSTIFKRFITRKNPII